MATSERHHHAFKLIARVQGLMDRHHTGSLVEKSQQIMLIATRAGERRAQGALEEEQGALSRLSSDEHSELLLLRYSETRV